MVITVTGDGGDATYERWDARESVKLSLRLARFDPLAYDSPDRDRDRSPGGEVRPAISSPRASYSVLTW